MKSNQRGVGGLLVAVVVLLVAAAALAMLSLLGQRAGVERGSAIAGRFSVIQDALVQFVAANGRLPCPALAGSGDGSANPDAATAACASATGTVPWKSLAIRPDDAIDPWGNKITYRVFAGAVGGLTQLKGASMEDCDLDQPAPTAGVDASGLCRSTRDTIEAEYLAGKGFTVNHFGVPTSGLAYVLVSHGPSGYGAYTTDHQQKPVPASADELSNLSAAGPFVVKATSSKDVPADSPSHFDDLLAYATIEEVIKRAGRGARPWPEAAGPAGQITFDQTTVQAAVGSTVTPGTSVGQVTVTFTGVVATGSSTGGSSDIGFQSIGGNGGIGVAGGGSMLLEASPTLTESLSLAITTAPLPTKFGITLTDFGIYSGDIYEGVQLRFFLSGLQVGATRFGFGCNIDGGLASFEGDVGTDFDRIDITPIPAFDLSASTSHITALLLTQFRSCPPTEPSCATSLATPVNTCTLF